MPLVEQTDISAVIAQLQQRIARNCERFGQQFPNFGEGTRYVLKDNVNWLAAFWPGLLWLNAGQSDEAIYRISAEALLPTFRQRLEKGVHITHDLGFLFSLSARAQWQQTGDSAARDLALEAADRLLTRYRLPGGYIQAWGPIGDPEKGGRIIADTMMNLPLLFWASEQTGNPAYHDAAFSHAKRSAETLIRADGSSYHTYYFDQATGEPLYGSTHQGFADDSHWARGQAWLIYGFALAAEWCDEPSFLAAAQRTADQFWAELPSDRIPYWDMRMPSFEGQPRDSSAGAIALCGLLRIATLSDDPRYSERAETLMQALLRDCLETNPEAEGLLKHGALHIPKGWAPDEYLIFGDYFFMEALLTFEDQNPDFWGPTR